MTDPVSLTGRFADTVSTLRSAGCVFAEAEAEILLEAAAGSQHRLAGLVERRCAGFPLEHVVGWAEFLGHRVRLRPGVFVPRRRSESLAAEAIRRLVAHPGAVVLDLCCGSGALGFAVAAAVGPMIELHASDIDAAAVACARLNLDGLATQPPPQVHHGPLFDAVPVGLRGRVDLLLANAPYVPSEEVAFLPAEARDHEPHVTLDGGADGLAVHRQIAAVARSWLSPGGALLIETSAAQLPTAAVFLAEAGLDVTVVGDEELDSTVLIGVRNG